MTANEKKAHQIIVNEVNKAMNLLESHLSKFCKDTNGTAIPFIYVQSSIKILMDGYNNGANADQEDKAPVEPK